MIAIGLIGPPLPDDQERVCQLIGVTMLVSNSAHKLECAGLDLKQSAEDGKFVNTAPDAHGSLRAIMSMWCALVEAARIAGLVPDKLPINAPVPQTGPNLPPKPLNRANEG